MKATIKSAILDHGYRLVDTATLYQNESDVGDALKECFDSGKVTREEVFVTSKIWKTDTNDVEKALKGSLAKLKLDYLDLYLIHMTMPDHDPDTLEMKGPPMHVVWKSME
jgi:diketogulonate reductase-like aldo/keto reductase